MLLSFAFPLEMHRGANHWFWLDLCQGIFGIRRSVQLARFIDMEACPGVLLNPDNLVWKI